MFRRFCLLACLAVSSAAVTFADLDAVPRSESLADSFKVSLVRPEGEPANSGQKTIVEQASQQLLSDAERQTLDDYDAIFEKYSLFCNGRWLGVQVLQDSQDLLYLQHIVYMKKPDVIIETGTYKGGLTYFFATILDWIQREEETDRPSYVLSVDRHHPDLVFAANWFCPPCADCVRSYTTPVWGRKVRFIQGLADSQDTFQEVAGNLHDLGLLEPPTGDIKESKTIVVNLDANHEFDGLLKELVYYAPFVTSNSYLIVQDAKLDKIWGAPGPTAAMQAFLQLCPPGEFVVEDELKFHAYSQHIYLRRAQVTVPHSHFMQAAMKVAAGTA
ncbi:Rhamnosyl O-methyltransferase [Symbiodinium microadriaticum]|uniref:Rhamnosyl O-methyltransferase n=1 Tax=Symbiodinium microadriaticum TaxID=2951 RepID=A0A1Q9E3S2_SYMMI|nr:Rhamnosyl O-methyltransferase [Symbiodinium microadriaticum]